MKKGNKEIKGCEKKAKIQVVTLKILETPPDSYRESNTSIS